jgi:hypothetical protein
MVPPWTEESVEPPPSIGDAGTCLEYTGNKHLSRRPGSLRLPLNRARPLEGRKKEKQVIVKNLCNTWLVIECFTVLFLVRCDVKLQYKIILINQDTLYMKIDIMHHNSK